MVSVFAKCNVGSRTYSISSILNRVALSESTESPSSHGIRDFETHFSLKF